MFSHKPIERQNKQESCTWAKAASSDNLNRFANVVKKIVCLKKSFIRFCGLTTFTSRVKLQAKFIQEKASKIVSILKQVHNPKKSVFQNEREINS